MSSLTEQVQRWLSGKHYGSSKPVLKAWVREGYLRRKYRNKPQDEVFCRIKTSPTPTTVWWAEWHAVGPYVPVPNLLDVSGENDFGQNGVEHVTMEMDNVQLAERHGPGSAAFHIIERGFMAPTRGDAGFNSAAAGQSNEWREVWKNQATQIIICAGYGEAYFPLFLGLVDTADLESRPDKITVTARSMAKVFTDQHTFMDAKNLFVPDPITFAPERLLDTGSRIALHAEASSELPGHLAKYATAVSESEADGQPSDSRSWISEPANSSNHIEWFDATLTETKGGERNFRLSKVHVDAVFANLEVFVSVEAKALDVTKPGEDSEPRTTEGHPLKVGWVDFEKLGNVPGTTIPYIAHYEGITAREIALKIHHSGIGLKVGSGSKVRLWFRNLQPASFGKNGSGFSAGLSHFIIYNSNIGTTGEDWIFVDDVSDIVRTVCQWAGFSDVDDWEIERVGSQLGRPITFDRTTFLIDIIKKIEETTSYTFQIKPPLTFDPEHLDSAHNLSMGRVTFRQNQAMTPTPKERRYSIRDDQTIKGIQPVFDSSGLAQSIRVRGQIIPEKENPSPIAPGRPVGQTLVGIAGRVGVNYRPVWARENEARAGGIRKQEFHVDPHFETYEDCLVACLLIAYRMALEATKATVEVPLFPIFLDEQIQIFDLGSGMSTRLWIVSRDWHWHGGEEPDFSMTLGGSLIDVDIVEETRKELEVVLDGSGVNPAPIARGPWEEIHLF